MPTLAAILTLPLRRPMWTFATVAIFGVVALSLTLRLRMDPSLQAMFSRGDASAEALTRVLEHFGAVDELLVMVSLPENQPADAAASARLLDFGDRLSAALTTDPTTAPLIDGAFDRPDADSQAFFERVLAPASVYYLDDASFTAARDRLQRPQMTTQLQKDAAMLVAPGAAGGLAKALMRDPLRLRDFLQPMMQRLAAQQPFQTQANATAFISPDGRSLLIRVRGKKPPGDLDYCKALTGTVGAVGRRLNTGGFDLQYAGSYAIAASTATAIKSDMIVSVTGSVVLLQLLFIFAYRSPFKLFAISFGPIALGLLGGFGAYALMKTGLSPMTAVLGGVLTGMAIDYAIQYLSMYESRRDAGDGPRESAARSAVSITPAAFAAWATSVVGFVAIGASRVNALRDFAILGSLGLAGAFLAKMVLMPLLLMLSDRRPHSPPARSTFRFSLTPVLTWIGRHRRAVLWVSGGAFALATAFIALWPGELLGLESDLTVMHPRPNPAIAAQNLIASRFGMHDWLLVDLRAGSARDLLALAHRVDARLSGPVARDAGVVGSFGLAGLLPDPGAAAVRQAQVRQMDAGRVVDDFRAAVSDSPFNPAAREIVDYEKALQGILTAPPPNLDDLIRYPRLAKMILPRSAFTPGNAAQFEAVALVFISGSTDVRASRDRAVDGVRAALAGEDGAVLTGLSVVSHDAELTVRHDLPRLTAVALALVLLYLLLHFRNLTLGALSIAPTAFSLVLLLAAMRAAGERVNMVNLVAAPLLIGIDVDYGIFLVALAGVGRGGRRLAADGRPGAVRQTHRELVARIAPVCHAVLMCAAATIIGYGSLLWTSTPAIRSLGFAVAVGIGACLFSVFFLIVPILFTMAREDESGDRPTAAS